MKTIMDEDYERWTVLATSEWLTSIGLGDACQKFQGDFYLKFELDISKYAALLVATNCCERVQAYKVEAIFSPRQEVDNQLLDLYYTPRTGLKINGLFSGTINIEQSTNFS
jgi:hypothetical protein